MTIDQRLEALTQTVELLAAMQLDNEKRWEERHRAWEERHRAWEERHRAWEERHRAYDQRFDKIATALEQDGENIRALARVAELHHERLSRLEDRH